MGIKEEILRSLNFFEVIFYSFSSFLISSEMTLCTFRPKSSIEDIFNNVKISGIARCDVLQFNAKEVERENLFPIFCVELKTQYSSLDSLIEDIMVWRLSGMMDKEMEGM